MFVLTPIKKSYLLIHAVRVFVLLYKHAKNRTSQFSSTKEGNVQHEKLKTPTCIYWMIEKMSQTLNGLFINDYKIGKEN